MVTTETIALIGLIIAPLFAIVAIKNNQTETAIAEMTLFGVLLGLVMANTKIKTNKKKRSKNERKQ